MKKPDKIKKGLEMCGVIRGRCKGCPYDGEAECISNHSADAFAYIQQLETALPKWISVEERLPEVSDVVLVIANGKPSPRITLDNACLIASYWGDEGWIADGFYGWDALQVTYWMPLPEAPKEDT